MPKPFFPEGMGGVQNSSGNSGGVGGLLYWSKNGNSGEGEGLREIPSVMGVWIFSGTTHSCYWTRTSLQLRPRWGVFSNANELIYFK